MMAYRNRFPLMMLAGTVLVAGAFAARHARADDPKPYTVEGGKVDKNTFRGYLYYGDSCMRCHGPDGAGSSYAPTLTDSLKHMSKEDFENTVINGRQNVSNSSDKVMPAFGTVEDVVNNLDNIYAYLKARSDGAIGRGRPSRIGEDD